MKLESSKMSGVVVTRGSPVLVRPSELEAMTPPPSDTVALTSFDRRVPPIPVTSLLVFDRKIDQPVETIKGALSRALAHYRPVAGRLDGAGNIACTDEGVTFVGASASCSLEAASAALLQMDLNVWYPAGSLCRDADPLLMVQVTEFTCGGFVVGVTKNHVLADGVGLVQFLQAVGELARGVSPPSVVPVRRWDKDDYSLASSTVAAAPALKTMLDHHGELQHHLARIDIVVPSSLISRVKAGGPCTVLDAVMAVLWRCRTRAAMSPGGGESPAPLKFVCNMRAQAGAPPGYYGNCIRVQVVPATAGAVATSSLADLVRLIRRAKEKVPDLLCSSGVEVYQGQPPVGWYDAFRVTDWRHLGLDAVDLGGGAPARVLWRDRPPADEPGCVVCPPRRAGRDDGEVEVSAMFLKPEHVDAFLGELASLAASEE